jgi:hypothetical protein
MERAAARRLQPFYIQSFFLEAFQFLGGTFREREPGRYQITHVPAAIRSRDRLIGTDAPVLKQYERICFDKPLISVPGHPLAAFVCPGHPLLDATIDLVIERHRDILKRGAVLVDPTDRYSGAGAVLFAAEHPRRAAYPQRRALAYLAECSLSRLTLRRCAKRGSAPYPDYCPAVMMSQ